MSAAPKTGRPFPGPAGDLFAARCPRESAVFLHSLGFWPVAIYPKGATRTGRSPSEGKDPIGKAWGAERWTLEKIEATFERHPEAGAGVCLGPGRAPAGAWLADIEGDGPEADDSRAKLFGGESVETLGWRSTRGDHAMLTCDGDRLKAIMPGLAALEGKGTLGMGVYKSPELPGLELRIGGFKADGAVKQFQSVVPPTPGTDGRPRAWAGPPDVASAPESFYRSLKGLATRLAAKGGPGRPEDGPFAGRATDGGGRWSPEDRAIAYLSKCEPAIQGHDGSGRCFKAACKVGPGFDLSPDTAIRLLLEVYNPTCDPPWSEAELRHKVEDAYATEARRGWILTEDRNGYQSNGRHEPNGKPPIGPAPNEGEDDPHRLARIYLDELKADDGPTLLYWQEDFHRWEGTHYRVCPDKEVRGEMTNSVKAEFDRLNLLAMSTWKPGKTKPVVRPVTTKAIGNVLQALCGLALLRFVDCPEQPAWLSDNPPFPAADVLPCRNALVNLPGVAAGDPTAKCLARPTPSFFGAYSLDFDYCPDEAPPLTWLKFLSDIWGDDPESVRAIQEWFGYNLTSDTSRQKIMMIIGPKRSGKGTIARTLTSLLGSANVATPTLAGFSSPFGAACLIGKPAAIFTDAKIGGRHDISLGVERLVAISGEDTQTIPRKNREDWIGRLRTRFTFLSNELPKLTDASGALPSRMMILRLTESFFGREDLLLEEKLKPELPAILLWAIAGWSRLKERGRFVQPESSRDLVEQLEDIASPVGEFAKELCVRGAAHEIFTKDLYSAWKDWCCEHGKDNPGDATTFGRNLTAACHNVRTTKQPTTRDGRKGRLYLGIDLNPEEKARRREAEKSEKREGTFAY